MKKVKGLTLSERIYCTKYLIKDEVSRVLTLDKDLAGFFKSFKVIIYLSYIFLAMYTITLVVSLL